MTDTANDERASSSGPASEETPSFQRSLEELEAILERIESDELDLDALADQLRRATDLLEVCREKIRTTELEVEQIVARLDPDS